MICGGVFVVVFVSAVQQEATPCLVYLVSSCQQQLEETRVEPETDLALQLSRLSGVFGLQSLRQFGEERRGRQLLPGLLVLHLDTQQSSINTQEHLGLQLL